MTQSSFIWAALLGGFVFFLAAKGRLPAYAAVLWGDTSQPVAGPKSGGSSSSDVVKTATTIASTVASIAKVAEVFA